MKIETFKYPHSSFLSMEKDMSIIVDAIMKNENLKKLLYYTTPNCMNKPNLTEDQTIDLFNNQIKLTPKIKIDGDIKNYLIIGFDNFVATESDEWRDNYIIFDIICHFDQWQLGDFKLRPYRIAAELDSMFNNAHLSGIGTLSFLTAKKMVLTDEFAGLCLMYEATHGDEDKKKMPNPNDEQNMIDNFNQLFE